MPTSVTPIIAPVVQGAAPAAKPSNPAAGFASMLSDAVSHMDQSTKAAGNIVERFLNGENVEVHDMVLATQKNQMQFEFFLQVRNKMVQAYQEVMRMQM